jgi:urease accessory protein
MIYSGAVGNLKNMDGIAGKPIDYVLIDWFDTQKSILRLVSESGKEIGIRQEHGSRLQDGDVLQIDDAVTAVKVRPCELLKLKLSGAEEAARLGYELGNRHLPVVIKNNEVTVPYDEPTFLHLNEVGFHPERIMDVFTGSLISHHHEHG